MSKSMEHSHIYDREMAWKQGMAYDLDAGMEHTPEPSFWSRVWRCIKGGLNGFRCICSQLEYDVKCPVHSEIAKDMSAVREQKELLAFTNEVRYQFDKVFEYSGSLLNVSERLENIQQEYRGRVRGLNSLHARNEGMLFVERAYREALRKWNDLYRSSGIPASQPLSSFQSALNAAANAPTLAAAAQMRTVEATAERMRMHLAGTLAERMVQDSFEFNTGVALVDGTVPRNIAPATAYDEARERQLRRFREIADENAANQNVINWTDDKEILEAEHRVVAALAALAAEEERTHALDVAALAEADAAAVDAYEQLQESHE